MDLIPLQTYGARPTAPGPAWEPTVEPASMISSGYPDGSRCARRWPAPLRPPWPQVQDAGLFQFARGPANSARRAMARSRVRTFSARDTVPCWTRMIGLTRSIVPTSADTSSLARPVQKSEVIYEGIKAQARDRARTRSSVSRSVQPARAARAARIASQPVHMEACCESTNEIESSGHISAPSRATL